MFAPSPRGRPTARHPSGDRIDAQNECVIERRASFRRADRHRGGLTSRGFTCRSALRGLGSFRGHHTEEGSKINEVDSTIEQWDIFELCLSGPASPNPFTEVEVLGTFRHGGTTRRVRGFYDGDGTYRIRFMPGQTGDWSYAVSSTAAALDGQEGRFECAAASGDNHGPVEPGPRRSLQFRDGTPFFALGTTSYGWALQQSELVERTLVTLRSAPFNKIRMCALPKRYEYVRNEPPLYPFQEAGGEARWDFARFNPAYFRNLERRVGQLREMGIQADLILFHPYDCGHWGFDRMGAQVDDRFLRYLVARVGAYRNVWWSLANEPQWVKTKTQEDWDRLFAVLAEEDPYRHMCSIHGGYDFGADVITHVCGTGAPSHRAGEFAQFGKPIVYDEHGYEGDLPYGWGNVSAAELAHQSWLAAASGAHPCAHSECYWNAEESMWWPKGGELHGASVPRLRFLRQIMEQAPLGRLETFDDAIPGNSQARLRSEDGSYLLAYTGTAQPRLYRAELPEDGAFRAEIIDTWNMAIEPAAEGLSGAVDIPMPARPYMAVRLVRG